MDWNALKIPNTDTKGMVERARTFLPAVGKVIDEETREWATEFQEIPVMQISDHLEARL